MGKTLAFTGLRPHKLPNGWDNNQPGEETLRTTITRQVKKLIAEEDVRNFVVGMAEGVDLLCASIVLEFKADLSLSLEAAIPYPAQAKAWSEDSKNLYTSVKNQCDSIYMVSHEYTRDCFTKRNHYMVDLSDFVLAVWDGLQKGGTAMTVEYALKMKKPVYIINPVTFQLETHKSGQPPSQ